MNKLILTLAMGTALALGVATINAQANEGSESHSEHGDKSASSSGVSGSPSVKSSESGEVEDANETEAHSVGTSGSGEAENDDAPPTLPALTPIGTDVLLLPNSSKHHGAEVKSIY
ncbi:MAG: hypothetical protein ABIN69_08100 [Aestuariivirga sp.]